MSIFKDYQSESLGELCKALVKASELGISGVCLTNSDPKADFLAIEGKNRKILIECGLSFKEEFEDYEDGIHIKTILLHEKSGEYIKGNFLVHVNDFGNFPKEEHPDAFIMRRIQYEGLLGIASSNNAIEAELFGPKRKHKDIPAPYDKTADFIISEFINQDGEIIEKKVDRKKFEKGFLGMTSEEEAQTTFVIPERRIFSWSDIKLFLRCKRCFYNAKRLGIKLNNFDDESFGLQKETDKLLKKEFDKYRTEKKLHPIMQKSDAIKLLEDNRLDFWRTGWNKECRQYQGIQFHDAWQNLLVCGAVDDLWLNDKKELIIVEYKSSTKGEIYPEYQKQIEFYAWIFKKRNYKVAPIGYLLLYVLSSNRESFDWRLEFKPFLKKFFIDDSWVQNEIYNALDCLAGDTLPAAGIRAFNMPNEKCDLCNYFDKLSAKQK